MPRLSLWAVRLALLYLLIGFAIGACILINKGTGAFPTAWRWLGAHREFLLIGWMGQFALGIAYWIFPRYRGNHRGDTRPAALSILLLNAGIAMVFIGTFWGLPITLWGRALEAVAALSFAVYAWPRVKPTGA